ncbi:MAG: DUF2157 domain-containing protein [Cyanobacteria bacterium J06621_11]
MSQENFRRSLRKESEQWWHEGLIDATLYEKLSERYQFAEIEATSGNRFIAVLLGLGGILLGLGAITLVAANWQEWSRNLRMFVIFSAFITVNGAGFYCWQQSKLQRLGVGLLLAGALIMGANIGLMSQMFHQSGHISGLYLVWGLGVLVMAYSLRLTALGILSWILVGLSYYASGTDWFSSRTAMGSEWISMLQLYLPLLMTPLYLPLAHWCRSRVLYCMWGVGLLTLFSNGRDYTALVHWHGLSLSAVFGIILVLMWFYHAKFWQQPDKQISSPNKDKSALQQRLGADGVATDLFQPIGRSLAVWVLSIALYSYSFEWVWTRVSTVDAPSGSMARSFLVGILGLGAIALYGIWQWFTRGEQPPVSPSLWMKTPAFIIVLALTSLGIFLQFQALSSDGGTVYGGIVLMNCLLAFVGFAMLHDGVLMGVRHRFWGGMGIVVISLMSRMFEYDTGLTLKAAVLVACGITVILAGMWFERTTHTKLTTLTNITHQH